MLTHSSVINAFFFLITVIATVCVLYLGLLEVQILANRGQKSTQALQRLLIMVFEQLYNAIMHDDLCEHFKFEQFTDELDIAQ